MADSINFILIDSISEGTVKKQMACADVSEIFIKGTLI